MKTVSGLKHVPDDMPWKKILAIKKYLEFSDGSKRIKKGEPEYDSLFQVRKVIDTLNCRFDTVSKRTFR